MTVIATFAARVAALAGWRRLAVAVLAGAATAFSLAPFFILPLLLGYAVLVWLHEGAATCATAPPPRREWPGSAPPHHGVGLGLRSSKSRWCQ